MWRLWECDSCEAKSTDTFPRNLLFFSRTVEPASNLAQWRKLSFLAVFTSPGGEMKPAAAVLQLSSVQENPAAVL